MPHVEVHEIEPGTPDHAKTLAFERRAAERPDLSYEQVLQSLLSEIPAAARTAAQRHKPAQQSDRMAQVTLVVPRGRTLGHWIERFEGLSGTVPDADGTRYPVSLQPFEGRDPMTTVISIAVVSP